MRIEFLNFAEFLTEQESKMCRIKQSDVTVVWIQLIIDRNFWQTFLSVNTGSSIKS
jgi:hypothetical protein